MGNLLPMNLRLSRGGCVINHRHNEMNSAVLLGIGWSELLYTLRRCQNGYGNTDQASVGKGILFD